MSDIKLKPGDIFCTRNPMLLGRAINGVQRFWSKDGKSEYSHSGIIIGKDGTTFEALWTNKRQNIWEAYEGQKVLIGRNAHMTPKRFVKGWLGVRHHEDKWYAGHRLVFFLIPPLAKIFNLGLCVCSELTAKFLYKAGIWDHWKGLNPDDIADRIHNWKDFEIIYEGEIYHD